MLTIGAIILGYMVAGGFTVGFSLDDLDSSDDLGASALMFIFWPVVLPGTLAVAFKKWLKNPARLEAKAAKRLADPDADKRSPSGEPYR